MNRKSNTNMVGLKWPDEMKKLVWEKGIVIPNYPKDIWRIDPFGGVMNFQEHGNRENKYGWEIDHINPVANGGNDDLKNLQPLSWEMNVKKNNRLDFIHMI